MESTKDNKRELLPVCPICNQFPLVTANIDEPGYINIKCNCGYEREKTSLKDYVSSILNNPNINNLSNPILLSLTNSYVMNAIPLPFI